MTLLLIYTKSTMSIRNWVFGIWLSFQNIGKILIHMSKKTLRNQPDFTSMVVVKLSYFHLKNFTHMHQLTCMSNSISFLGASKKITSRYYILMMVMYFVVCLLMHLFQN